MDNGESSYRRFLAGDNEGMLEIVCEYQAGLISANRASFPNAQGQLRADAYRRAVPLSAHRVYR